VLGGGVGGITAAFELTATPAMRERFKVTVYQLGWRIGGKGASGRNAAANDRIEEHGLHIWFGFYDNAFRVMRDAYEELGREPGAPLATFDDAFKPCSQLVLYDKVGDRWHGHAFQPPRNQLRPGDPGDLPTFWEMAATACRWALNGWRGVREDRPELEDLEPPGRFTPSWFADLARDVAVDLLEVQFRAAEHLLALALRLARARARRTDLTHAEQAGHSWFLVRLLTSFRDWLWTHVVKERQDDPGLRMYFTMFDTFASSVAGIVKDGVLQHGFDAINDEEWATWLSRNGAKELTVGRTAAERSPILRSVYDVAFGYPEGDIDKANVAAGTAINDLLRLLFSYRGSVMYKMQAGMGDVVFTPLYEVLKQRGVRFEFFHAVESLGLAPDADRVEEIKVVPQVDLSVDEYDPLVGVDRLDCWPSEPKWDQIVDGDALSKYDFERDPNPLGREPKTLTRDEDFDHVVLGIPVGALEPICGELMQRDERFKRAIETAVTVRTQAFQVWADKHSGELGWEHDTNSVAGCYVEPLDTYCDMSHLVERESWGDGDGVRAIGYFCGVLPEGQGADPDAATAHVKDNAIEFLERDVGSLWPASAGAGAAGGAAAGFDWSRLVDHEDRIGAERFDAQYWRANTSLSDRYVLTTAGSVEHRLPSAKSGFDNLMLAGDWTKNGIDGGCVEAAVVSGMQAARGLIEIDIKETERPAEIQRPIVGEDPEWVTPGPQVLPPYVEYGGRATSPGPFLSLGGKLRGFVLDADGKRMSQIVQRTLNAPAGRGVDYRAVGSQVILLVGGFERVSSMTAPFDRWGTVREIQASFWIPVAVGQDHGEVFVAERFGLALPYIWVDNPMSYLGGRENFGYPKTMGRFEPSSGVADRMHLETFGGNFGRDEGADWHPILDIEAVTDTGGRPRNDPIEGPDHLIRYFVGDMLHRNAEGEVVIGGMRMTKAFVDDVRARRVRQLFLKQFRDAVDGSRACYQSVVETPIEVKHLSIRPSRREWDVKLHLLDSHPVQQEIGVASQRASLAFEGELDMVVKNGIEIGRIQAATGLPAGLPVPAPGGPGLDGYTALIESITGRVLSRVSSLERRLRGR
jgi:uncharacterized protein with NAD-binding domain and iron-sulfur cluster